MTMETTLAPPGFYRCVNDLISFMKDKHRPTISQSAPAVAGEAEQNALPAGGVGLTSHPYNQAAMQGEVHTLSAYPHVGMLLNSKGQPCRHAASSLHPPLAQSCATSPGLPGPRDQDLQGMLAALKRNTSLSKFSENFVSSTDERREEWRNLAKAWMEPSGF